MESIGCNLFDMMLAHHKYLFRKSHDYVYQIWQYRNIRHKRVMGINLHGKLGKLHIQKHIDTKRNHQKIPLHSTTPTDQLFYCQVMMTSSNGIIFHVTGHLWGESTGENLAQRAVTRSFDVFIDLRLNKLLSN